MTNHGAAMRALARFALPAIAGTALFITSCVDSGQHLQRDSTKKVAAKSGRTEINGTGIHYLEWGKTGPSIVMLHGLNDDAGIWQSLAPRLASDYHVVAPDRRGAGKSDSPNTGSDAQSLILDLAGLIRNLKLGPVVLVGHSAGAETALKMAAHHPEMIRSVILIDGGFWPYHAGSAYNPEELYPLVSSPALLVFARQTQPGRDVLDQYQRIGQNYFEQLKLAEQHVREVAGRKLRRGRMIIIDDTSHAIQTDQPETLARTIKKFLSEAPMESK